MVEYLGAAGMAIADDETAWCSAFVNWVMQQIGVRGTHRPNARSWLAWDGLCLGKPHYGAITILSRRGAHSSFGHVGFYVGEDHGEIVVLGGNQTNASSVCLNNYPMSRLLGYRWPPGYPLPR